MARPCTICAHPKLKDINRMLVDSVGVSSRFRQIAGRFGVGFRAVERHATKHLTDGLKKAVVKHAELVEETTQLDVLARLGRLVVKAETMLDAADSWLRDPEDPTRYTLGPREHEVFVIWEREVELGGGRTRTERTRERLAEILKRCGEKSPSAPRLDEVMVVETKFADPRKLLLDAVSALKPVLELLGKAYGQIRPDPAVTINAFLETPEWAKVEGALLESLRPYPPALEAAGRALATIGGSDDAR